MLRLAPKLREPELASVRPLMIFNSVDLPAPLIPTTAIFSWRRTEPVRPLNEPIPLASAFVYADSALAGLAGMFVAGMLGDWLIPFVYNVGLEGLRAGALAWMFLGAAVALKEED